MKTYLILAALALCSPNVFAHESNELKKPDSRHPLNRECLELCGTATVNGKPVKNITVRLYQGENLIVEVPYTQREKLFFGLRENSDYTLIYSLPGYSSQMITFNTRLPAGVKLSPVFSFDFTLELFPESVCTDIAFPDFPAALVSYNPSSERFECNQRYADSIHNENFRRKQLAGN